MYDPQEDSIMLRDALIKFLSENKQDICLDMGTGTGIQGIAMAPFCKKVICVDINDEALKIVSEETKQYHKKFLIIKSNLFENLHDFKNKVDLICFNPPYLPREKNEEDDRELKSGETGLDITHKFLFESKEYLSENGKIFFVASSLANLDKLNNFLKEQKYKYEVVSKQHFFFEDILVYEAWLNDK